MTVHASFSRRNISETRLFHRRVAVPAVYSDCANVMGVTKRYWLLTRLSSACCVIRRVQLGKNPGEERQYKDGAINRNTRECVSTAMENLGHGSPVPANYRISQFFSPQDDSFLPSRPLAMHPRFPLSQKRRIYGMQKLAVSLHCNRCRVSAHRLRPNFCAVPATRNGRATNATDEFYIGFLCIRNADDSTWLAPSLVQTTKWPSGLSPAGFHNDAAAYSPSFRKT